MHNGRRELCAVHRAFCIFTAALCTVLFVACSVPNLDTPECVEARNTVKQFYSLHFDNERRLTPESISMRERFLTPDLSERLRTTAADSGKVDYFTASEAPATTFKIARCETIDATTVDFLVQIFWRDDIETIQKELQVLVKKTGDNWLISKVSG